MKRIYILVSLSGLITCLLFSIDQGRRISHTNDFRQYYAAALVVRSGDWSILYPSPIAGGLYNAGRDAIPKVKYLEMARFAEIDAPQNFIQPPAAALLAAPLALFNYPTAEWIWRLGATFSVWLIAMLSGRLARLIADALAPTLPEIFTITLICFLPNKNITPLNVGNVSPFVGLAIAVGVLSVVRRNPTGSAAGFGVATLLKISPALLLIPAFFRIGYIKTIRSVCLGGILLATSLVITGVEPWVTFVTKIAPTLGRPWLPGEGNDASTISIYGLAYLVTHQNPLPKIVEGGLKLVSIAGTISLAIICLWKRKPIASNVRSAVAGLGSLVTWPLVFAPLTWGHYSYYHLVLTGWFVAECGRPGIKALIPVFILFLNFGPWGKIPPFSESTILASFVPLIVSSLILVFSFLNLLMQKPIRSEIDS